MSRRSERGRIGLLACAFDAGGREILDALAARPDLPRAYVFPHHAEDSHWFRQVGPGEWAPAPWSEAAGLGQELEAAIADALDARRWLTSQGGVDLLDVVLLAPVQEGRPFGAVPPEVLGTLRRLRARFRKIGRVLVLADGRFETSGEAAPPGVLIELPLAGESEQYRIDLIVLLDRIDEEGNVHNDRAQACAQAAGVLFHLTLGELAPVLFQRIQAEQARLGEPGRYATLGLAEWRLSSQGSAAALADALYRQLADRILHFELSSDADDTPPPADPWFEAVEAEMLKEPERTPSAAGDPVEMALRWDQEGLDSLRQALSSAGWNLSRLTSLLHRRLLSLQSLNHRMALRLSAFMSQRFARWYATGGLRPRQGEPAPTFTEVVPIPGRKALRNGLAAGGVAAIGVAVGTDYTLVASVIAAAMVLGAVMITLQGFERRVTRTGPVPLPPPDLTSELHFRRNRSWIAGKLALECARQLEGLQVCRERLREDVEASLAEPVPRFPFHSEVCMLLLNQRGVEPSEVLGRFWVTETAALAAMLGRGKEDFASLLREHAARTCEHFAELGWGDILHTLGGSSAPADPAWRESLAGARAEAVPWLPVAGLSRQTFLALPDSLPADLRDALSHHFPGPKALEESAGGGICFLHLSQGFRVAAQAEAV